jgi:hypothetical protein
VTRWEAEKDRDTCPVDPAETDNPIEGQDELVAVKELNTFS